MASPSSVAVSSLETEAPQAAVTRERKLNPDLQEQLPKPYLARAMVAVDQQHVAFFDRNGDGIVYPWETFKGMRAIGCGFFTSLVFGFLINLVMSYPTQPGWLPSLLLSVHIKNIHKAKHGSDSETYDTEGRFDPSKFDAIFSKYSRTHPDALTKDEMNLMLKANRNIYDFLGWIVAIGEWHLLYSVAKDKEPVHQTYNPSFSACFFSQNSIFLSQQISQRCFSAGLSAQPNEAKDGLLQRETVRGVFDASLFERLQANKKSS